MSLDVNHSCEDCRYDPEKCFCDRCLDVRIEQAYKEGYEEGRKITLAENK